MKELLAFIDNQLRRLGRFIVNQLHRFLCFLRENIPNAIISAIVASIIGPLIAFHWQAYQEAQINKFASLGETNGIAYPAQLFQNARDEGFIIEFQPLELQNIAICGYQFLRGRTWEELVFKYLDIYKECFIVNQKGRKYIKITPNFFSGYLYNDKKKYRCGKCFESMERSK